MCKRPCLHTSDPLTHSCTLLYADVINTAGRQLPNLYELHGIRYLTYPWADTPDFQIFDANGVVVMQLASFIDEGEEEKWLGWLERRESDMDERSASS